MMVTARLSEVGYIPSRVEILEYCERTPGTGWMIVRVIGGDGDIATFAHDTHIHDIRIEDGEEAV